MKYCVDTVVILLLMAVVAIAQCSRIRSNQCIEGQKEAFAGNCSLYLECVNGNWQERQCDNSTLSFDSMKQECRQAWQVSCQNAPLPCTKENQTMQVPGQCGSYFSCLKDGSMQKHSCSLLERYSLRTSTCVSLFEVDCSKHDECSLSLKMPVNGSKNQYKICEDGQYIIKTCGTGEEFDFNFNDCVASNESVVECGEGELELIEGSCSKYYKCVSGRKVEQSCGWFQRFDTVTMSCVYMWNADCSLGNECKSGDKVPSGVCTEYFQCQNGFWLRRDCGKSLNLQMYFDRESKDCMLEGAKCSNVECAVDGLKKELPGDCSKYQVCRNNHFYVQDCGRLQKFDSERNECRYVGVDCTDVQEKSKCSDGERVSIDGSCYGYKECSNGQFTHKYCLYPLYRFDKATKTCTFMATCTYQCYEGERKAVVGKCNQYYVCSKGDYQLETCPLGENFDVVTHLCQNSKYATCISNSTATI